ncbi:MAG: FMN-binding protein [Acidobacteria bacterium]|nr:FMN-binding protein [Acidobacteriota bacterium]
MRDAVTYRMRGLQALCVGLWIYAGATPNTQALSREEALAGVYPGAQIRAEQLFLTPAQMKGAAVRAGTRVPSALVARYVASRDGRTVGRAYVDTHTVRTKKESLLISLDSEGHVLRLDVTAFLEPPEFHAPEPWLRQYQGRGLTNDLAMNRALRPLAGATLTARAATEAVRRVLAVDQVLMGGGGR